MEKSSKAGFISIFIAVLMVAVAAPLYAGALPESLKSLLSQNRYPLNIHPDAISGAGGDMLTGQVFTRDIVFFGENHGIREIAVLARVLFREAHRAKNAVLVTEISPSAARFAVQLIEQGRYKTFLQTGLQLQAIPFFNFTEEIPLLEYAALRSRVIGLDQEFMASAPVFLDLLSTMAVSEKEIEAVNRVKFRSWYNPFLIGMGSPEWIKELQSDFAGSKNNDARKVIALLDLSSKLYRENMGGDYTWSNNRREDLLEEHFIAQRSAFPDSQAYFFKFGAFHLFTGQGITVEKPLGNRVLSWAGEQHLTTTGIYADCFNGTVLDALLGTEKACEPFLSAGIETFEELVFESGATVFDLRPLKNHPDLSHAPKRLQRVVEGYDYAVLVRNATPSLYAEGTLVARRFGLIAVVILLLIISALVFAIRFWFKKRKRRSFGR
jgi:hypothetical protein